MSDFLGTLFALLTSLSALIATGPALISTNLFPVHEVSVSNSTVTILFAGDMMFDRYIRTATMRNGPDHVLSCMGSLLDGHDLVVANLEGPITPYPSMSVGSVIGSPENFTFTFPTSTASLLKRHHIELVNIGNNHIMNFGRDGLIQTKKFLDEAGVSYFGDPSVPETDRVKRMEIQGIPFSFVNWSDWTSDKTDHTVAQVKNEASQGRTAVVYTHWGDEYVEPPARVRQLARSFVDAGAVLIIGSHPHVIQEHEVYKGRHIYYSLGNFVFDQYWNDAVRTGLLVRATFDSEGRVSVEEMRTQLERDGRTCPLGTYTSSTNSTGL